jgi:hypothetical protein
MIGPIMVGRGSRFTKPRSQRSWLLQRQLDQGRPACRAVVRAFQVVARFRSICDASCRRPTGEADSVGTVERCLACEAVMNKAISSREALSRTALYGVPIELGQDWCTSAFAAGARGPSSQQVSIQSADKRRLHVMNRSVHNGLASEAALHRISQLGR